MQALVDEDTALGREFGIRFPITAASYTRRKKYSGTQLRKPRNSHSVELLSHSVCWIIAYDSVVPSPSAISLPAQILQLPWTVGMIPNATTLVAAEACEVLANEWWSSSGMSEQVDR